MPSCLLLSLRPDRSEIADVIRDLGVDVDEMDHCAETLGWLGRKSYDAIIVESYLPKEHGWDFASRIRPVPEQNKKAKIFLLCDDVVDIPSVYLEAMGMTCLGRPIYDLKMRAVFRTFKVI